MRVHLELDALKDIFIFICILSHISPFMFQTCKTTHLGLGVPDYPSALQVYLVMVPKTWENNLFSKKKNVEIMVCITNFAMYITPHTGPFLKQSIPNFWLDRYARSSACILPSTTPFMQFQRQSPLPSLAPDSVFFFFPFLFYQACFQIIPSPLPFSDLFMIILQQLITPRYFCSVPFIFSLIFLLIFSSYSICQSENFNFQLIKWSKSAFCFLSIAITLFFNMILVYNDGCLTVLR